MPGGTRAGMIGLWLESGELRLATDLPVPDPPPGEALIRVLQAGICNTDLELVRGYYPYAGVPGHEFVGVVERAPQGDAALEGQRVVGEINAVCGECDACRAGRSHHCERRTVLGIVGRDGAFAEYLSLPAANLHVVAGSIADDVAVFVEPLAAALEIQEQIDIAPADRVLVVGDGKLGQLIARTLALTGCDLCVAGRHADKLELLAGRGIETVAVPAMPGSNDGEETGSAAARRETTRRLLGFDVVVECSGNPGGFELARQAVRPRGTIVLKSTYAGRLELDASGLVVDEITLLGSRCGPFDAALELLERGAIEVADLIAERYPLSAGLAAFDHARRPEALKVLLTFC